MNEYLDDLTEIMRNACTLAQRVGQGKSFLKQDASPVTVADYAVQAYLHLELKKRFGPVNLIAEETAQEFEYHDSASLVKKTQEALSPWHPSIQREGLLEVLGSSGPRDPSKGSHWVLDPIDGTKGYLRKEQYAIALALMEDGVPLLGILGCPNLGGLGVPEEGKKGCLLYASIGVGAQILPFGATKWSKIYPREPCPMQNARIIESVESAHTSQDVSKALLSDLQLAGIVKMDSQCKYAAVAKGDAEIYLRLPRSESYKEKIWDHAAGYVIVKESGGIVVDFDGEELDFSVGTRLHGNRGIIATTQSLVEPLLLWIHQNKH